MLNTNLVGTFLVSKYVAKEMLDGKKGTIINISSNNAIGANYEESMDYDASKAGIISLTHNFALALKPYVRVNCVCPGWINTESVMNMNPNYLNNEMKRIGQNELLDKDYVAKKIFEVATGNVESGSVIEI